jgi:hypothetical protein
MRFSIQSCLSTSQRHRHLTGTRIPSLGANHPSFYSVKMNAKQNRRKAAKPAAKHVNHFRPSEVAFPSPRKDTIRWVQDFGAVLVDYPLSGVCLGRMGDDQQSREQFLPDLRITSACIISLKNLTAPIRRTILCTSPSCRKTHNELLYDVPCRLVNNSVTTTAARVAGVCRSFHNGMCGADRQR